MEGKAESGCKVSSWQHQKFATIIIIESRGAAEKATNQVWGFMQRKRFPKLLMSKRGDLATSIDCCSAPLK